MILSDRFVYVHQPKTGGTFVTSMVERLPGVRSAREVRKHGTCAEIPPPWRALPVLATFRDPWRRYVSQYQYGWWRRHLPAHVDRAALRRAFPSYPDLTFPEFVRMANRFFCTWYGPRPPRSLRRPLGFHSSQMIRFFCMHPGAVWRTLSEEDIASGDFERRFSAVRFLRVDRLNRDLHDQLLRLGWKRKDLRFILDAGKVLPEAPKRAFRSPRPWHEWWTPSLEREVRGLERLVWAMFPEAEDALARARAQKGR